MIKGRCTKYGTLVLHKAVREYLEIHEGDFFSFNTDSRETEQQKVVYFLKTTDNNGSVTIEKKSRSFYIRLHKYLNLVKIDLPCTYTISRFLYNDMEGFKVEFVNR